MENESIDMGGSGDGGGAQANSRWNPTKEQISMLESLYSQGIRTPSTEQIQQITSRLKAFGHIEGKNVFYWFQNHKARQRQKQKQESMSNYINHFYLNNPHHHPALFSPPAPNVLRGSYCLPQSDSGFYPQCHKVIIPNGIKRRQRTTEKNDKAMRSSYPWTGYEPIVPHEYNNNNIKIHTTDTSSTTDKNRLQQQGVMDSNQETLPLFPLHPTGVLQGKEMIVCSLIGSTTSAEDSINSTTTPSGSSRETNNGVEDGFNDDKGKPFFDFFPGLHGCF